MTKAFASGARCAPEAKKPLSPWIAATAIVTTLAVCAVPYSAPFRDWRYGRMDAAQLAQIQEQRLNDPIFLYHFGKRLNEREQFGEALPVLQRAVGIDENSARLRDEWAKAQMGSGKIAAAFGQLKQFAAKRPESADAQRLLGKLYISNGADGPARNALEKAVVLAPNNGEAWSLLAHTRLKMGDRGGGEGALKKALALRPDSPESADDHLQLAVLLAKRNDENAKREYQRGIELTPKNVVARREYSRYLMEKGDAKEAEVQARAAIQIDGGDALARLALARCLMARGDAASALPELNEAAKLAPMEPQPAELLRRAYRQTRSAEKAQEWDARYAALCRAQETRRRLKNETETRPNDRTARTQYAAALAEIADVNGSARQHAAALRTTPDNARALIATARDLNRYGHADLALPLLRQALATTQMNPEAFEVLGDVQCSLGRVHEAAIAYERIRDWREAKLPLYAKRIAEAAAKTAHSDAPADRLFRQAEATPDTEKSKTLLRQALALEPDNTHCLRSLLRREFRMQEKSAATLTAQKLLSISPEDGVAHSLLAILMLDAAEKRPLTADEAKATEMHLQFAERDLSVTPTVLYGFGWLALKQGSPKVAVQYFEAAIAHDPDSLAVYRRLAEAKDQLGDAAGAQQAQTEFERRAASPN